MQIIKINKNGFLYDIFEALNQRQLPNESNEIRMSNLTNLIERREVLPIDDKLLSI